VLSRVHRESECSHFSFIGFSRNQLKFTFSSASHRHSRPNIMTNQPSIIALRKYLENTIVGQADLLDKLVVSLLTGGHILVEGLPGLAKTTAVKALANGVHSSFRRIQFTPDLLPGDLTGTEIFNPQSSSFNFAEGPLFHEIILADEINRAPAKVQAALLEAMQEKQITVGGVTRPLPELFMVMATQNPLDQAGTYPLPEAQMDRFLLHVMLDYPSAADELLILQRDRERCAHRAGGTRRSKAHSSRAGTRAICGRTGRCNAADR
jgi:MoxR-like ATPase